MKGTGSPDETGEPGGFTLHQAVMIIPYYPVLRSAMRRPAARIWPWRIGGFRGEGDRQAGDVVQGTGPAPDVPVLANSSLRSVRAGSKVPAWCRLLSMLVIPTDSRSWQGPGPG